jgi:uncharacterized repeat protein (TIGR03847 family)
MDEKIELDMRPVHHITTDAIGEPGKRVFYLQGTKDEKTVSLIIEKVQLQTLTIGVEQFLGELYEKFPDLPEASAEYDEENMYIKPPVEPLFRVGELGLGYDPDADLMALVAREINSGVEPDTSSVVRYWCTRSQVRALCHWGLEVTKHGRPICRQCGQAKDPEGHFCAKKNGHKH